MPKQQNPSEQPELIDLGDLSRSIFQHTSTSENSPVEPSTATGIQDYGQHLLQSIREPAAGASEGSGTPRTEASRANTPTRRPRVDDGGSPARSVIAGSVAGSVPDESAEPAALRCKIVGKKPQPFAFER